MPCRTLISWVAPLGVEKGPPPGILAQQLPEGLSVRLHLPCAGEQVSRPRRPCSEAAGAVASGEAFWQRVPPGATAAWPLTEQARCVKTSRQHQTRVAVAGHCPRLRDM